MIPEADLTDQQLIALATIISLQQRTDGRSFLKLDVFRERDRLGVKFAENSFTNYLAMFCERGYLDVRPLADRKPQVMIYNVLNPAAKDAFDRAVSRLKDIVDLCSKVVPTGEALDSIIRDSIPDTWPKAEPETREPDVSLHSQPLRTEIIGGALTVIVGSHVISNTFERGVGNNTLDDDSIFRQKIRVTDPTVFAQDVGLQILRKDGALFYRMIENAAQMACDAGSHGVEEVEHV